MTNKKEKQANVQMFIGACPECDNDIIFKKRPSVGQKRICPECRSELRVIGLSPIELDWAFSPEYDEDEEYEDEN